eukprot:Phypoly_transcript_02085.p1 GENE.Phypoly_transcript_02085~~Phypoly_transcript_02085.p1  ORF type:complete len:884 (+),score=99.55 Phypoly_transcript_02085:251-2902(+)
MLIFGACDAMNPWMYGFRTLIIATLATLANGLGANVTFVFQNTTEAQFKNMLESAGDGDQFVIGNWSLAVNGTISITRSINITGQYISGSSLICEPFTQFLVTAENFNVTNLYLSQCPISATDSSVFMSGVTVDYSNAGTAIIGENSTLSIFGGEINTCQGAAALEITGGALHLIVVPITSNATQTVLMNLKNLDFFEWNSSQITMDRSSSVSIDSSTLSFNTITASYPLLESTFMGGFSITNSQGTINGISVSTYNVGRAPTSGSRALFNVFGSRISFSGGWFLQAQNVSATYFESSTSFISDLLFSFNSGGAVIATDSNIQFSGTRFMSNSALDGGALLLEGGYYYVTNCTMQQNQADSSGGAVVISSGQLVIDSSDISNNRASDGGAIAILTLQNSSMVLVTNSTIKGNTATVGQAIYQDSLSSILVVRNSVIQESKPQNSQSLQRSYCCNGDVVANPSVLTCNYPACNSSCANAIGCNCPFLSTKIDVKNPPLITNQSIGCNCSSSYTGLFCTDGGGGGGGGKDPPQAPTCKKCVHGNCSLPDICTCDPGWTGIACDAQPVPTVIHASSTSPIVTLRSASSGSNQTSQVEFGVTVASVSELTVKGKVDSEFDLQRVNYHVTTYLGNTSEPNDMWVYRGILGNGANISITFITINDPGGTFFPQFNNEYFVHGSLKVNVAIYKWPFQTFDSKLNLNFTLDVVGQDNPRLCSQGQNMGDSVFGTEVTFRGSTIYAQFQPVAIVDGRLQNVNFSATKNLRSVTAIIPQFRDSIILDPNYVLLEDYRKCGVNPINRKLILIITIPLGSLVIFCIIMYYMCERRNRVARKERAHKKEAKKQKKEQEKKEKEKPKTIEDPLSVEMTSQYTIGFNWNNIDEQEKQP